MWTPTAEQVRHANVSRLIERSSCRDYDELLARSQGDVGWFWDLVVADLGIEFDPPYERVYDDSRGIAWTTWFTGGGINAAAQCLQHDGEAVRWESEDGSTGSMTYAELRDRVARFAGGLPVEKGDAVGIFLPLGPDALVAFLGTIWAGAIAVPMFSGFGAGAIAARREDSGAKLLVTAEHGWRRGAKTPMLETAREAAGPVPVALVRDIDGEPTPAARTGSEDPMLIAYTSGTTGKPKGAVHVHGGFTAKVAAEGAYQADVHPGDVLFWFTDLGWIMGPWEIIGTLATGGTLMLYDGAPDWPTPQRLWEVVERHGVNILGISPTLIRAIMRHGPPQANLSALRVLGSTGEPWNPDPYDWYAREVGGGRCPVINISGGTEVGACFLSPTPVKPIKTCSLGGPALGMAVDVFDPDGKPLRGTVGELVCTKPWPGMTRGIWKDPDRFIDTYWSRWPNVWVHGDWASVDADGEWFLHGRSDDTLNIAGKRIGPAEIESVLVSHPDVIEAAAVGVPDEVKGETVWCYVVASRSDDALRDELKALVGDALGKSFRPSAIKFTTALPKTRNAKVLRRAVRAVALGRDPGDLSSLESPAALDAVANAT